MLNLKDFQTLIVNTDNKYWYNNTGCQYPLVCPKGTKVQFVSVYRNYYGVWYEVEHEGKIRYIMPCYVDGNVMVSVEQDNYFDVASCRNKQITILTDRYGQRYLLKNDKGELELL